MLTVCSFAFSVSLAVDLTWGEHSAAIGSVVRHKVTYLNLSDVERSLPVTVKRDFEAGLFVLCTEAKCLPVFGMDPEEFQQQDTVAYAAAPLVAQALGCTFKGSRNEASFECAPSVLQYRRVGSKEGDVAPGLDTLSASRQGHKVVLVFVRSLDWDPFSQALVRQLQNAQDSLRAGNAQVIVMHGYEPQRSTVWKDSLKLSFPIVADDASATMRGYDVFDRGPLPRPAVFVIDQSGVIRLRQVFEDLSTMPDTSPVMQAVARIP